MFGGVIERNQQTVDDGDIQQHTPVHDARVGLQLCLSSRTLPVTITVGVQQTCIPSRWKQFYIYLVG